MAAEDDAEFRQRMAPFPNCFSLNLRKLTKDKLKAVKFNLLGDVSCGFSFQAEEVQAYNLISYFSFLLGEQKDATKYNRKAIEKDPNSTNALAISAWMNRKNGKFYDAEKDVQTLEAVCNMEQLENRMRVKLIAQAEMAFAYARFGPKYHEKAISHYEAVFLKSGRVDDAAYWMWRYDYGLTLRRTLHFLNREYKDVDILQRMKYCARLFAEIIAQSQEDRNTARSYAELGELAFEIETRPRTYPGGIVGIFPENVKATKSITYFEKALEVDGMDFDVLCVSGKYYRYVHKLEQSVRLLKKALEQRETSKAHHHLALSIRKILSNSAYRQRRLRHGKQHVTQYSDLKFSYGKRTSASENEKFNMMKMVKCHEAAPRIPENDRSEEVLHHLDRAMEIDNSNAPALYDKAYTVRRLGKPEEAIAILNKCSKLLDNSELKVSCLEQAGYCCLDLATDSSHEQYTYDAVKYFQRAIELCASLVGVNKNTAEVRSLVPTVKVMLTNPNQWETTGKELKKLKELLEKYADVLPIYKDVCSSEDESHTKPIQEMYRQEGRHDDAALIAALRQFAEEASDEEFSFDVETILHAASDSLSRREEDDAKSRYQVSFQAVCLRYLKELKEHDVFFASDHTAANLKPVRLMSSLLNKYAGLRVANYVDDFHPGRQRHELLDVLVDSTAVVVAVFNIEDFDEFICWVITTILSLDADVQKPRLVIVKGDDVKVLPRFSGIPTIEAPNLDSTSGGQNIETDLEVINGWIKEFIMTVME